MNIKYAFTFAELMISLVIIAVITAILYPTISDLAPNNNKHLFRSAYKTIELVTSEITSNSTKGEVPSNAQELCKAFKAELNTIDNENCSNNSLQSSNGMRWLFKENRVIYVDVNASNNNIETDESTAYKDEGKKIWEKGSFTGSDTAQDTFKVIIQENGKITIKDSVGVRHMQDSTNN